MHEHVFRAMHHTGPDGRHWCPTGYAMCDECDLIIVLAAEDAVVICNLWGEFPTNPSDTPENVDL